MILRPMKTLSSVLSIVLAATLWPRPAHGDDGDAFQSLQLTPQIQSMLAELRKGTDLDLAAGQSSASPIAPLIALATALFQEPTGGNQQQPVPRAQAMRTQMLRATDADRPVDGALSNPIGSLMALVTRVFDAAPHGTEMQADVAAQLAPQIQAASIQLPKAGNGDRAPRGGTDKSVASLMALLNNLLSQSSPEDRAQLDQMAKLIPQVQSMVSQLLKEADIDVDNRDGAPPTNHRRRHASASTARDGSSQTANTDGPTSGTLDGSPRMTDQEWRQLFPLRK